jgi:hypothetical protein
MPSTDQQLIDEHWGKHWNDLDIENNSHGSRRRNSRRQQRHRRSRSRSRSRKRSNRKRNNNKLPVTALTQQQQQQQQQMKKRSVAAGAHPSVAGDGGDDNNNPREGQQQQQQQVRRRRRTLAAAFLPRNSFNSSSDNSHDNHIQQQQQQQSRRRSSRCDSLEPRTNPASSSSRAVWIGRIVFIFVILLVTLMLGTFTYKLLAREEQNQAEVKLESIAHRALLQAKDALYSRRWAGTTMAGVVGDMYPNASQWPYVEWWNFEAVVNNMLQTSHGVDMGFVPFVKLEQQTEFEVFAQDVYRQLGFPPEAGVCDPTVGFGIWGRNDSVTPIQPYHDTTAETPYNSPNTILAPIFRTDEGYHPVLLFNPHSQAFTGNAIDTIINCSEQRSSQYMDQVLEEKANLTVHGINRPLTLPPHQCGVITDIFWNVKLGGKWSVANFFPIYPTNDPLTVSHGEGRERSAREKSNVG